MKDNHDPGRLSRISTIWEALRQAHEGTGGAAAKARQLLVERYSGAVYRYLHAALRDPHAAEDLTQEFALRLIRGDFRKVSAERGRFRDYVKTVLFRLVSRHHKRRTATTLTAAPDSSEFVTLAAPQDDLDRSFLESWREQLLGRAWEKLAEARPAFYTVLRFRSNNPQQPSHQLAEALSGQLGKAVTAEGVRQTLSRAREKLADLLLEEVAASLESPTAEQVEEELRELNLLVYCRRALTRYSTGNRDSHR
jgi:RNA polymerase sigma-70 factor (ECF subfamily)